MIGSSRLFKRNSNNTERTLHNNTNKSERPSNFDIDDVHNKNGMGCSSNDLNVVTKCIDGVEGGGCYDEDSDHVKRFWKGCRTTYTKKKAMRFLSFVIIMLIAFGILFSDAPTKILGKKGARSKNNDSTIHEVYSTEISDHPSLRNETCVVSVVIGDKFANYSEAIIKNKEKYCERMGYKCFMYTSVLREEKRPLSWQKVHAIIEVLNKDVCGQVLWLDADAIVVQPHELPKITEDIALGNNLEGTCTGVMLLKNTMWTKAFFSRVAATSVSDFHPYWEQGPLEWERTAILHLIFTERETPKHIEYLSQPLFNSYEFVIEKTLTPTPFIYHMAWCKIGNTCEAEFKNVFGVPFELNAVYKKNVKG